MKTTKKDFELFKKECQDWIDILGLKDWEVRFKYEFVSDDNFAETEFNTIQRWVDIKLNMEWPIKPTNQEIKKAAFHEALELRFADIRMIASSRSFDQDALTGETHKIINVFQNIFFD